MIEIAVIRYPPEANGNWLYYGGSGGSVNARLRYPGKPEYFSLPFGKLRIPAAWYFNPFWYYFRPAGENNT
jgi:hypothetical protein